MALTLGEVFGDHMVLQRDIPLNLWGSTDPSGKVTVRIQGKEQTVQADSDGRWQMTFPPLHTSYSEELVVSDEHETICLKDVQVGEVWVAGGQSNMEFFMRYDRDFQETVKNCENPDIRFFDYPEIQNEKLRNRYDYSLFGFWRRCDLENLQYYSAVAYYFAAALQKDLKVPVGIMACNYGGTRAVCWMDEECASEVARPWLEDYQDGLKKIGDLEKAEQRFMESPLSDTSHPFDNTFSDRMMYGISKQELIDSFAAMASMGGLEIGPWAAWRPCGLYHTMLEHIMPYSARGVIWYQGESDEDHEDIYCSVMKGLIELWRRKWNLPLPFLIVQLAPFGTDPAPGGIKYPTLRRQQKLLTKECADVYMTTTGDVGHVYDIHPKEKKPVGERLALLARGHVYGEEILCDPPEPDRQNVRREGNIIRIPFLHADGGLVHNGNQFSGLQVLADDEPAGLHAEIEGSDLLIELKQDAGEVTVRLYEEPYFEADLFNKAGIPAEPFTLKL